MLCILCGNSTMEGPSASNWVCIHEEIHGVDTIVAHAINNMDIGLRYWWAGICPTCHRNVIDDTMISHIYNDRVSGCFMIKLEDTGRDWFKNIRHVTNNEHIKSLIRGRVVSWPIGSNWWNHYRDVTGIDLKQVPEAGV